MFHASQESAQTARNQVTHLSEEVASLQTQLNAANAALKAAVAEQSGGHSGSTLHRIPAPLGGSVSSRAFRSRLTRKTSVENEHQSNAATVAMNVGFLFYHNIQIHQLIGHIHFYNK